MNIAIGADIGGTHITSAAIDLDSFSVIENSYYNQKMGIIQRLNHQLHFQLTQYQ